MLRTARILLAVFFLTSITLLFLDSTGTLRHWLGWTVKAQFFPAFLSMNIAALVGVVLLTLLFGRLYCSTICPLGVLQDVVSWLAGKRKKYRFVYRAASRGIRWMTLALFVVLWLLEAGSIALLIAPYSAFGRIATSLLAPAARWGTNFAASLAAKAGGYFPGPVEERPVNGTLLAVAIITLAVIVVFAWRKGRLYCNLICPVGTVLGLLARFSLYKPRIHSENCVHCGLCAKNCKASCIDSERRVIDYSRCVACGDCLTTCRTKAIRFETDGPQTAEKTTEKVAPKVAPKVAENAAKKTAMLRTTESESTGSAVARRGFLTGVMVLLASKTVNAQKPKDEKEFTQRGDGGLAPLKDRAIPERETPIAPPGAESLGHFDAHCTACQLCVAACPNQVLRPSTSFKTLMKPVVSFERGWCRPECVECSSVCPAGAIRPITVADKSACQVGHAVWTRERCIVLTDEVKCDNCFRHCPTEAIQMVPLDVSDPDGKKIPAINTEKCIGCGACEFLCPARPRSAIHVEGHQRHRTI